MCAHLTASFSDRELRYLWTWAWFTPYSDNMRKTPPTASVQNVCRSVGSGFKLNKTRTRETTDEQVVNIFISHYSEKVSSVQCGMVLYRNSWANFESMAVLSWTLTQNQRYVFPPRLSSRLQTLLQFGRCPPRWRPAAPRTSPGSETRLSRSRPSVHPKNTDKDTEKRRTFYHRPSLILLVPASF